MLIAGNIGALTILLLGLVALTCGYSVFRDRIPNGINVPHPCKPNFLWKGVGHTNALGGGDRNNFGSDFLLHGATWNRVLCLLDSDGDGLTNGQELGDPGCEWTQGGLPARTSAITHPGVCDPWENATCRESNAWVTCDVEAFDCPAIREDSVLNMTLRFPPTPVPNKETNYMCMTFDLPGDAVYDLIATQPLIDNEQVMHHTLIYGCSGVDDPPTIASPQKCGMEAGGGCGLNLIGGWSLGDSGKCYNKQAGFRFGKGLYTRVVMEFHWNNPEKVSDYTDSSGMTLFYTRALRPFSATTLVVGQRELEIPARQPAWQTTGSCPGACSRVLLNQPVYVTGANNHMHYLGKSQKMEVFRQDKLVATLTSEEAFSYDSPVHVVHDPPVEILPGDDIRTTCVFNSLLRNTTTRFGQATSDEMCLGFLEVFPAEAFPIVKMCVAFGERSICDRFGGMIDGGVFNRETTVATPTVIDGCDWTDFSDTTSSSFEFVFNALQASCAPFGPCDTGCSQLRARFQAHPCLHGAAWLKIKQVLMGSHRGLMALAYLDACPLEACPMVKCQGC